MSGGSLFLYGPSGAGKSTVGKVLAAHLELDFLDLDAEIEQQAQTSIAQIMSAHGEGFFRALESAALRAACNGVDTVVALGGGALLNDENRRQAEENGKVILLEAETSILLARLRSQPGKRPLLTGDLEARLTALLSQRREHYASFPVRVDAAAAPEEVARAIRRTAGRHRLRAMGAAYDALIYTGGLAHLGTLLSNRGLGSPALLVSDSHVAPLYAGQVQTALEQSGWRVGLHVIPAGESHKTLDTVSGIWQACLQQGLDRSSMIIALGGGMVTDLAGFAASTFMRGCRWVALPTSLLAMVDAALGGKTGFDLPAGKNLIGTFSPPALVLADPQTLATLPERELRAGLAEVVKHGVIADPELFELCAGGTESVRGQLDQILSRAMAVKIGYIESDPYERGARAALNFGHTIGHAVELVSRFTLLHGEAVAIGMVAEARLAERFTVASPGLSDTLAKALSALGLPTEIPLNLSRDELVRAMRHDKKKNAEVVRFSLPVKIGEVRTGIPIESLEAVL